MISRIVGDENSVWPCLSIMALGEGNTFLHEIGLSKDSTAALHSISASTDCKSLFLFLRVSSFMYLGILLVPQSPTSKIEDIILGTQTPVISLSPGIIPGTRA